MVSTLQKYPLLRGMSSPADATYSCYKHPDLNMVMTCTVHDALCLRSAFHSPNAAVICDTLKHQPNKTAFGTGFVQVASALPASKQEGVTYPSITSYLWKVQL